MRRLLFQTSAIQSLGVVLMLMTTLLVSRIGGPSAQGSFALVKSFNDLQVAIFSLGLPSAIVIMLNRTGHGYRAMERLTARYLLGLLVLLPPINLALLSWTGSAQQGGAIYVQAALIGWGCALFTAFAFLRALLLVHTDGPVFSLISILHWIFIFTAVVLLINRSSLLFEIVYFAAGIGSLAVIYPIVRRYRSARESRAYDHPADWPLLRSQASHVMLQTTFFGLQPFVTNAFLARADPGLTLAGLFNIAALVIAIPNLLVAFVAPVLLNRWSKELDWLGFATIQGHALVVAAVAGLAALLALPLLPSTIHLVFGAAFSQTVEPTAILLLAVFAVVAGRILTPAMQGLGRNDIVSCSCAMRVLAIAAAALAANFIAQLPLLVSMAIGWCAGEYAALAYLLIAARRIRYRDGPPFASIGEASDRKQSPLPVVADHVDLDGKS